MGPARGRMRSNKAMIGRNNLRGISVHWRKVKRYGLLPIRIMVVRQLLRAVLCGGKCRHNQWHHVLSRLSGAAMLTVTMVRKAITADIVCTSPQRWKATRQMKSSRCLYEQDYRERDHARTGEYLWIHRRFKTRPVGESSLYFNKRLSLFPSSNQP